MQVRASARGVRMSPRKAQLVVESIRGRSAAEALAMLQFDPHAAARVIWKVVRSAIANAENNYALSPEDLYVVSATADKGPGLPPKYRAKARGQAAIISRKTTHITVVVDDEPGQEIRLRRQLAAQTRGTAGAGATSGRRGRGTQAAAQAATAPAVPAEPTMVTADNAENADAETEAVASDAVEETSRQPEATAEQTTQAGTTQTETADTAQQGSEEGK